MQTSEKKSSKKWLYGSFVFGFIGFIAIVMLVIQLNSIFEQDTTNHPPLIDGDSYILRQNATLFQIELFQQLLDAHDAFSASETEINQLNYASLIAKNFIADFFTLSNKLTRNDVGGLQFFSNDIREDFNTHAIDVFYLHLNQHQDMFGLENLPTVASSWIIDARFEELFIEEVESTEPIDQSEYSPYAEVPAQTKRIYERVIVIDIGWDYEATNLPDISKFQTSARITLRNIEGRLNIYIVDELLLNQPYGTFNPY